MQDESDDFRSSSLTRERALDYRIIRVTRSNHPQRYVTCVNNRDRRCWIGSEFHVHIQYDPVITRESTSSDLHIKHKLSGSVGLNIDKLHRDIELVRTYIP